MCDHFEEGWSENLPIGWYFFYCMLTLIIQLTSCFINHNFRSYGNKHAPHGTSKCCKEITSYKLPSKGG